MKITQKLASWIVVMSSVAAGNLAVAQCQGGGQAQSAGNAAISSLANSASPYVQNSLQSGYNQNSLGPASGYNQFMGMVAASEAYNQSMRNARAMQVASHSMMVQTQVAQAKAMRKQMNEASAQMRKAAQAERAEALAAKAERDSARRSGRYEVSKLASK